MKIAFGLILAPIVPLMGLLAGWWGGYAFLPESWIPYLAITGLLAGVLVDVFLLKRLLDRRIALAIWLAVYLFYSIGIFGFFMGVPVFNAALAIPAGFVMGARLRMEQAAWMKVRRTAFSTAWFTTGVLAVVCVASAAIALASPSTASDLRGMLGLSFEVTQGMIIGLISVGGVALLAICWGLSFAVVHFTHKFLSNL